MKRQSRGGLERVNYPRNLRTLRNTPPWEWPPYAGKLFREVLADNRARLPDRLIAAELAGDLVAMDDDVADALLRAVGSRDEPEQLRAVAATSLGPALEHADTVEFDDPLDVVISEETFHRIRRVLHTLYLDDSIPELVRRRILEASVRSPQDWHREAINGAYSSGDRDWMLTAVFGMKSVPGFDDRILEALKSRDTDFRYRAIEAAGNWGMDAAWDDVVALVRNSATPKRLLLAAIEAVGNIRPGEADGILFELSESDDEEIAEAAEEAMMMADAAVSAEDDEDFEGDDFEGDEDDRD